MPYNLCNIIVPMGRYINFIIHIRTYMIVSVTSYRVANQNQSTNLQLFFYKHNFLMNGLCSKTHLLLVYFLLYKNIKLKCRHCHIIDETKNSVRKGFLFVFVHNWYVVRCHCSDYIMVIITKSLYIISNYQLNAGFFLFEFSNNTANNCRGNVFRKSFVPKNY